MIAITLLLWLSTPAEAMDWSVDPDGLGDVETITEALEMATAGDSIAIAAGTYGPSTGEILPWYVPSYVTIEGVGRYDTTIDCEGEGSVAAIRTDGVMLSGLGVTGCTDTALWGSVTLSDCAFYANSGSYQGALYGSDVAISDCEFSDNEVAVGYGTTSIEGTDITLVAVTVEDRPLPGQHSVNAQSTEGGCSAESSMFIGGTVRIDGPVSNSLFLGLQGAGGSSDYCAQLTRGWVENVTVIGCSGSFALIGGYVRNSLVAFNAGSGIYASYAVYNLVHDNPSGDWYGTDWSGMLGNTTGDPLFRDFSDDGDWTDDDLRLSTGSPAIDAASGDYPSADLDGVHRPQDGDGDGTARADIGAYEWGLADHDGDGWAAEAGDCDDLDAETSPDTPEIPYDGIDQDCDGEDLVDVDGDGHDADHQGGDDCDDTDASIHPGAWDIPDDGIDQDCDGVDAHDEDGDGWSEEAGDCAPDDDAIHPGADELCDGVDNDCNGLVDDDCDTGVAADDTGTPDDTGADDGGDGGDDTAGGGTDTGVGGQPGGRGGLCGCRGCADGGSGGAAWVLLPLLAVRRRRG